MARSVSPTGSRPSVGLAYNASISGFVTRYPTAIDHIEIPFELLRHDPAVIGIRHLKPLILHCASLSIAGTVPPTESTIHAIQHWIHETNTPWLGEHLAFISAELPPGEYHDEYAPGMPYNIGYTVAPPMNEQTLISVAKAAEAYQQRFDLPLLLENSPLYFSTPGSSFTQTEFITRLCRDSSIRLLIDLTHLYISGQTLGFDPLHELEHWPLDRVLELHLSGVEVQDGMHWDNHADATPEPIYELLDRVLQLPSAPQAITLEYNWHLLPDEILLQQLTKVRELLEANSHPDTGTGPSASQQSVKQPLTPRASPDPWTSLVPHHEMH